MPPKDQARLEACTNEIAEILYRNSNRELSLRCAYLNGLLAA